MNDLTDLTIPEIVDLLSRADDEYHNEGTSALSDSEYDTMRLYLKQSDPTNLYFIGIGSDVRGGKQALPLPMPSLAQVEIGDAGTWWNDVSQRKTAEDLVITEKLDGVSALLAYDDDGNFVKAYSRGNGTEGADITRHLRDVQFPKKIAGVRRALLRCELIFSQGNFEAARQLLVSRGKRDPKNARNSMAGILNASETNPEVLNLIDVKVYSVVGGTFSTPQLTKRAALQWLEASGFKIPLSLSLKGRQKRRRLDVDPFFASALVNLKRETEYEIDGIVVEIDDLVQSKVLDKNIADGNPVSAMKYKVADASNHAVATVTGIEWNLSKHGYFKPKILIEPIELVGVTISKCTGFNARFIVDNGIGKGAKISLTRSGDVIPFCKDVVESVEVSETDLPDNARWNATEVDWEIYSMPISADEQSVTSAILVAGVNEMAILKMVDMFTTLRIDRLKKGNVSKLYDAGYKTPASIINMTCSQLTDVLGANGETVYESLKHRLMPIEPWTLYGSYQHWGRGVGQRKWKKLFKALGVAAFNPTFDQIVSVDGFEETTANKIVDRLVNFHADMADIEGKFEFESLEEKDEFKAGVTERNFVFSGVRDKALEIQIERASGNVKTTVSNTTDYLVCKDPDGTSAKLNKARSLGVELISLEQLLDLLK